MKLKYTSLQLFLETIGALTLFAMLIFVAMKWNSIPSQIPMHYNALGAVDKWGGKSGILFMPIVSVFLYLMLSVVSFFPKSWNMPSKVREENKPEAFSTIKTMLILMKIELVGVFFYITYRMTLQLALETWFLPAFLIVLIGTIAIFTVKTVEKSK